MQNVTRLISTACLIQYIALVKAKQFCCIYMKLMYSGTGKICGQGVNFGTLTYSNCASVRQFSYCAFQYIHYKFLTRSGPLAHATFAQNFYNTRLLKFPGVTLAFIKTF